MKVKLSPNAFVRQYGPYSYIVNSRTHKDFVFSDAQCFFDSLVRVDVELSDAIRVLRSKFEGVDEKTLEHDFLEFLRPLVREKMVCIDDMAGEILAESNTQEHCNKGVDGTISTHDLLDTYFEQNPTPFSLQMDVVQSCTERCIHCYVPEYRSTYLPFDKIRTVIDEFRRMGGLVLSFSGGECMMHPHFLEVLSYAHDNDLMIKVLSNLTLCNDETILALKNIGAEVQTSLYSMDSKIHDTITQKQGSWSLTKQAIEKLHASDVPCIISCPIMKANQDDFPNVYGYATDLGYHAQADFMIIAKMNGDTHNLSCRITDDKIEDLVRYLSGLSIRENREYYSAFLKSKDSKHDEWLDRCLCSAGIARICLGADGSYFPCPGFGGYVLGNCYEDSLDWVWNESPNMLKMRRLKGRDFIKCATCQSRKYCSICLCRNFNETGNMLTPTEFDCSVARINRKVIEGYK